MKQVTGEHIKLGASQPSYHPLLPPPLATGARLRPRQARPPEPLTHGGGHLRTAALRHHGQPGQADGGAEAAPPGGREAGHSGRSAGGEGAPPRRPQRPAAR